MQMCSGALEILQQDADAVKLLPAWRCASSMDEIQTALIALRGTDRTRGSLEHTLAWLPYFYEIWCVCIMKAA